MKKVTQSFHIALLILISIMPIFGLSAQEMETLPAPKIKIGTAKVTGNILNAPESKNKIPLQIRISYYQLIGNAAFDEFETITVKVDSNYHFDVDVPLMTDKALASISLTDNDTTSKVMLCLGLDQEKPVHIDFDMQPKNVNQAVVVKGGLDFNALDGTLLVQCVMNFDDYCAEFGEMYGAYGSQVMTPKEYLSVENEDLNRRTRFALDSLFYPLTPRLENLIKNYYKMRYTNSRYIGYKDYVEQVAKRYHDSDKIAAVEPDKSYYSFLKYDDLNNPNWIFTSLLAYNVYESFLYRFLDIKAFGIPPIGDMDAEKWLKIVKNHVADVIGFNDGFFYDMLVAASYSKQISKDKKPFTQIQKANINKYFNPRESDMAKILLGMDVKKQ
jgi:hypothetical protein